MSNALFDDEDEYKPQEVVEQPAEPMAEAAAVAENPYEIAEAQPQPAANPFDDAEEEEYKPQEVVQPEETMAANPYPAAEESMPIGFGSERADLMNEPAIQMPTHDENAAAATSSAASTADESGNEVAGSADLMNRANNAKTNLIQEILAFNNQREEVEGAGEDHKDESEQASLVFTVRDPVKVGKVTKYQVSGRDSNGDWTCQRRFNEFEALARCLNNRWPGCYIPSIPEKVAMTIDVQHMKMQDNSDAEFVEGRRILLEKFLRELSHFEYLLQSQEFQIFCRGQGEVTSQLDGLDPLRPVDILEKFRLNFAIDEDQAQSEMLAYKDKITNFQQFLTRSFSALEKQAEQFRKFSINFDQSHQHYKKIYLNLMAFEDMAVDCYSDGDRTKRILSHPVAQELPTKITENIEKWRNPFKDAWMCLRGEVLDIKAMMNSMSGRTNQEALQHKAEAKQREKKTELEKMTLGKTTLKSFFKSKSTITKDIDSYSAAIQQLDVDIDNYKKLVNFITIYHGQIAIDKFKRLKSQSYYKMLNSFSIKEVSNAHLHATLSHSILEMQDGF